MAMRATFETQFESDTESPEFRERPWSRTGKDEELVVFEAPLAFGFFRERCAARYPRRKCYDRGTG